MRKKYQDLNIPNESESFINTPEDTPIAEIKPKKKKVLEFVDKIIILCLVMCFIISVYVMIEYHRLDQVLSAGEIVALLGVWGGELLLIVVRQVLGSDFIKYKKEESEL